MDDDADGDEYDDEVVGVCPLLQPFSSSIRMLHAKFPNCFESIIRRALPDFGVEISPDDEMTSLLGALMYDLVEYRVDVLNMLVSIVMVRKIYRTNPQLPLFQIQVNITYAFIDSYK